MQNDSSTDPVCGMRAGGGISLEYKGKSYQFCSDFCKQQFEKEPEKFIGHKAGHSCH